MAPAASVHIVVARQRRVEAPVEVSATDDSESCTSSDDLAFDDVNAAAGDDDEYLEAPVSESC